MPYKNPYKRAMIELRQRKQSIHFLAKLFRKAKRFTPTRPTTGGQENYAGVRPRAIAKLVGQMIMEDRIAFESNPKNQAAHALTMRNYFLTHPRPANYVLPDYEVRTGKGFDPYPSSPEEFYSEGSRRARATLHGSQKKRNRVRKRRGLPTELPLSLRVQNTPLTEEERPDYARELLAKDPASGYYSIQGCRAVAWVELSEHDPVFGQGGVAFSTKYIPHLLYFQKIVQCHLDQNLSTRPETIPSVLLNVTQAWYYLLLRNEACAMDPARHFYPSTDDELAEEMRLMFPDHPARALTRQYCQQRRLSYNRLLVAASPPPATRHYRMPKYFSYKYKKIVTPEGTEYCIRTTARGRPL